MKPIPPELRAQWLAALARTSTKFAKARPPALHEPTEADLKRIMLECYGIERHGASLDEYERALLQVRDLKTPN